MIYEQSVDEYIDNMTDENAWDAVDQLVTLIEEYPEPITSGLVQEILWRLRKHHKPIGHGL